MIEENTTLNSEDTDNPYLTDNRVNMGDLNLFGKLDSKGNLIPLTAEVVRSAIVNRQAIERSVLPGDIVNKANPSANYAYYWWLSGRGDFEREELQTLIDEGYRRVRAEEFWARRWERDANGCISAAGRVLFAIPEALWLPKQREKLGFTDTEIDKVTDGIHSMADSVEGIETFEIRAGEEVNRVKSRKTK